MDPAINKDLIFLVLQFLNEERFKGALHKLECESGCFFNLSYFNELIMNGKWNKVEKYLSCFTKISDNNLSEWIFREIRKQKYLEALDEGDLNKAHNIFVELDEIASKDKEVSKDLFLLFKKENFRKYKELSKYTNKQAARDKLVQSLKVVIHANPIFQDKLSFPKLGDSGLRNLISLSLNGQHLKYKVPSPQGTQRIADGVFPVAPNAVFQPAAVPPQAHINLMISNQASVTQPAVSAATIRNPGALINSWPCATPADVSSVNSGPSTSQLQGDHKELPKIVVRTLDQGSSVVSMDFNPNFSTLLLVGTAVGDIGLWEVSSAKVILKSFQLWNVNSLSDKLMSAIQKDASVSVCRVRWNHEGTLFGVAYSKHIVQIFSYHGRDEIMQHREIDAHIGSVNDLGFANNRLITCGDDRTIKIWEVATSTQLLTTLEGHEAAVHSLCPHVWNQIPFLLSTSLDGKIKAWLYDQPMAKFTFDAPGGQCTTMAYSADGARLFSCGTNLHGEKYLVEWEWEEGQRTVKRTYQGLHKQYEGNVHFDMNKKRILAAGDQYHIKFWDMDNSSLLDICNAEGSLPCTPPINFNKEGNLLAVSTNDNRIKILATSDGMKLLHTVQDLGASRIAANSVAKNGERKDLEGTNAKSCARHRKTKIGMVTEMHNLSQFRSLTLHSAEQNKVARLTFTHSGKGIIALLSNGIHRFWKWKKADINVEGEVTTVYQPYIWKSETALMMINDITNVQTEEASHCFTLSNSDSYLISTSGGPLTLFNVVKWQAVMDVLRSPPAVTCVAFNPQDNNLVTVGMNDSTIQMYDFREQEFKVKAVGHFRKITGLAFSLELNALVSAAADAEIIVWSLDTWVRQRSTYLQIPNARVRARLSDTEVQFHKDQKHFLAIHETQLALYETSKLICIKKWARGAHLSVLVSATFSCDSQLVYACFLDGLLGIFSTSTFELQCMVHPMAYIPESLRSRIYPTAIASNPNTVNQFAVGLSDGRVILLEPLEAESEWGRVERGSTSKGPAAPDHVCPSRMVLH